MSNPIKEKECQKKQSENQSIKASSLLIILALIIINGITFASGINTNYVVSDHLGSASLIIDSVDDSVVWSSDYEPFGSVFNEQKNNDDVGADAVNNRFSYNAKEQDDSTGFFYYDARYYDAGLGRFLSADSIIGKAGNPQELNRYAYVKNNPMGMVDPTGNLDIRKDLLQKFGVDEKNAEPFFPGQDVFNIGFDTSDDYYFKYFNTHFQLDRNNIHVLRKLGEAIPYPKNLVSFIDYLDKTINPEMSDIEKVKIIYNTFQEYGLGVKTYNKALVNGLRAYFNHKLSSSEASSVFSENSDSFLAYNFFKQVEGWEEMSPLKRSLVGGVCRHKASLLRDILVTYGVQAGYVGYYSHVWDGNGHAVVVVNFKDLGEVYFDPTNFESPVPLALSNNFNLKFFPKSPNLNEVNRLTPKILTQEAPKPIGQ